MQNWTSAAVVIGALRVNNQVASLLIRAYGPRRDKPVFGVSEKARLKPVSLATETSYKIEISLEAS